MTNKLQANETAPVAPYSETKTNTCRHCGGHRLFDETFVDGAHPICHALRPLEQYLDAVDDPTIEDETYRYRETVWALMTMWARLPRGEKEKTSHFLKCELANTNRMYAEVYLGDEDADDKANQALAFAALREAGLEVVVAHVFAEDDPDAPPTLCLDVHGVSPLRQHDFFWWLVHLLKPFGGHVETAGYADAPGPNAKRQTDH